MKHNFFLTALGCLLFFCSFASRPDNEKQPGTITRTEALVDGKKLEKTVILLDGSTSREDLIHTCQFLAGENVQLTFDKLSIGRSFLGLAGKQRIRVAEGTIRLANGAAQSFKAGGITSFRFIKIQYTKDLAGETAQLEMIEIVD
ncbi:MAG TPA: hypothetical protein VHK69_20405 [Chitinophagaceae bacterium]|jgi:hypothetical protein|nr:hypothetical protein [Chitinophagaceae bacterium]